MARVVVPVTDITPPKATLTTSLTGADNDLIFTAVDGGPGGNSIYIEYIVSGNDTPLSVTVAGFRITVNVATDGGGAATSTASQVTTAILANSDAKRLVSIANASSNDGTGVVTALTATALTGGALGITIPSQVDGDATNNHYFTGNDGQIFLEVVSSDASPRTVTFLYAPDLARGFDAGTTVETVAAGATKLLGPFTQRIFNQNGNRDVYFNPSVPTTLKFRAYRLTKV